MIIFEALMLLCFGAAWPFSIYKSYRSKSTAGKSVIFLGIIALGYVSGIIYKVSENYDNVVFLYGLNLIMVCADIALYYRNKFCFEQAN